MFDFDREINRRQQVSNKWNKYQANDILPLWVADMDFASPPEVIDAWIKRAQHGIFGYAEPTTSLIEAVFRM